ncbi:MAG: hypothetical protein K0S75_16 [Clostridia bacterium]|jgi:hypothetical protein|nr:hypothetical protein [Clostridia bacterium]
MDMDTDMDVDTLIIADMAVAILDMVILIMVDTEDIVDMDVAALDVDVEDTHTIILTIAMDIITIN